MSRVGAIVSRLGRTTSDGVAVVETCALKGISFVASISGNARSSKAGALSRLMLTRLAPDQHREGEYKVGTAIPELLAWLDVLISPKDVA